MLATGSATLVVPVKLKVSVPAPPTRTSAGFSVVISETKVSSPAPPVNAAPWSIPVVSD
jgi:hypothetical protein